ncbi:MAG TPA: GlxA family transcriptional regulator [Candidatus Competibacteraceae bacterium]|nr:GlxA family transcriptional regulator [Candidatus Competibacteraceae bacterium]
MFREYKGEGPEPIGFVLVPQFSMMAFFSAVEPLRVANRMAGRQLFSWHAYSLDGQPVAASNGMTVVAEAAIADVDYVPTLIVCAGFDPQQAEHKPLLGWLRMLARKGAALGGMDTGPHILAKAGLLDGCRVTMHWEAVPAFREEFPHIEVSDELFEVDGNRFTCAGGTAALDMMLHMIARKHGHALAVAVSEQFIHDRIRDRRDHQRMQLSSRLGVHNAKLLKIVEAMHQHLEDPLDSEALAALGGVSARQLERLFRVHLKDTPSGYYLKLRLERARHLLKQSDMSVMEVAMACGFGSASSLSRAYRARYGLSPRQDRSPLPELD